MQKMNTNESANSKTTNKKANSENNDITDSFPMLIENMEKMFQFFDSSPDQIEIFTPDGTAIFCNRSCLEFNNIPDANLIVGKYNVLQDPKLNDEKGLHDSIHNAFKGEVTGGTYSPPVQDLVDRGIIEEKPFESAILDFSFYPVFIDNKLAYVVSSCKVKYVYHGRPDVVKAKEYIDTHWQEGFDKAKLAKAVGMSAAQLYRIFSEHAGLPPGEYYNRVKVQHIKEKLDDPNLSIKEAFAQCGENSQGYAAKLFKGIIGLSPLQYRKQMNN